MEYKVTIIMPSLNVGKYMNECLQSVARQTIREIEIICVDAGSTDGTLEIIQQYANQYENVKLICSDIKSYGYQVNLGIQAALGQYIAILDTDDFVVDDMYEKLYMTAQNNAFPDFVRCDHDIFLSVHGERMYIRKNVFAGKNTYLYGTLINPQNYQKLIIQDCYIWNGIYKKSFLEKNDIKLNQTPGASFQDNGFAFQCFTKAETAIYINFSGYRYRRDNDMASVFSDKGLKNLYHEYEFIYEYLKKNNLNSYLGIYYRRYYDFLRFELEIAVRKGVAVSQYREILKCIHDFIKRGIVNKELPPQYFSALHWFEINILIEDIEKYIAYITDWFDVQNRLYSAFISELKSKKEIVIFGAGNNGSIVATIMKKEKIDGFCLWCDNDIKKQGMTYMGIPIMGLSEAVAKKGKVFTFVIAVTREYTDEIRKQLLDANIELSNIIEYPIAFNPLLFIF